MNRPSRVIERENGRIYMYNNALHVPLEGNKWKYTTHEVPGYARSGITPMKSPPQLLTEKEAEETASCKFNDLDDAAVGEVEVALVRGEAAIVSVYYRDAVLAELLRAFGDISQSILHQQKRYESIRFIASALTKSKYYTSG